MTAAQDKAGPGYTQRDRVYRDGEYLGDVALFSDGRWRCSSHPSARSFADRKNAVLHLRIARQQALARAEGRAS